MSLSSGGRQEFSERGLLLPTELLHLSFQGTMNAKNLRKLAFLLPTGGSMFRRGAIAP